MAVMTQPFATMAPTVLIETAAARVSLAAPTGRLSLRARGDLAPLNAALGLSLPTKIGQRAETETNADADGAGPLQVLCLGPDEWSILAPLDTVGDLQAACAAVYASLPHSLVDISGRETSLVIDGPRADELLSIGCPRDLDSIPVGEGRRTNFDDVAVVLWRDGPTAFRMDIWHSFSSHLYQLLETGCRELAAEPI